MEVHIIQFKDSNKLVFLPKNLNSWIMTSIWHTT